ncbi:3-mercaptopyruvate sulfurtransferase [Rhodovibrionaceae bacterium A322]
MMSLAPLVSTEWLDRNFSSPDIRVVDASYFLPNEDQDARKLYEEEHIPGAVFFDIDDVKDPNSPLPHMLPAPEIFSSKVRKLGLGDGLRLVIYDRRGLMSAPRVWWTFKYYGHNDVFVLDGGLEKWKAEGRPLDDHPTVPMERHFMPRMNSMMLRDKDQLLANLTSGREQVIDARAAARFDGSAPEPREGLRSGHIPGSLNVPWTDLMTAQGTMKDTAGLKAAFEEAGVDLDKPIVTSCGSGVTAAVLLLGLSCLGQKNLALYDGSWSEWGLEDAGTPVETGPAAKNG